MEKKGRLIFLLIVSCCFFAFVYWITYRYTFNDLMNNKLYDEEQLIPESTTYVYTPAFMQQQKLPVEVDVDNNKNIVTARTVFIIEKYNETTGELTKEILPIPIELLGLDYDEIQEYTLKKSADMESENGRLELVAFNQNLLVFRHTDEDIAREYMFMLVAEWGKIVVYKYYEETLYTKTNIKIIDLPYDLQEKIKKGMPVENERELFMFLESYSS